VSRTIALLTDFGSGDIYAGVMKGVIWSKAGTAQIADITHSVESGNIRQAAFLLKAAEGYFPADTIFVIVVDPGVGSLRRAIGLKQGKRIFLAPDNGCLTLIMEAYAEYEVRQIENRDFMLNEVSRTFQGRDIFAAAAGMLAAGGEFERMGGRCGDPVTIPWESAVIKGGLIEAEALHIDKFGNVITNIPAEWDLSGVKLAFTRGRELIPLIKGSTFSEIKPGETGLIRGSAGYYEMVMNHGSAAGVWDLKAGDRLNIIKQGADG